MKKYLLWAMLFALPVLVSCNKDKDDVEEENSPEISVNKLIGTWYLNLSTESEVSEETVIFSSNGAFVTEETYFYIDPATGKKEISSQYKLDGTYELKGSNLITNITNSQFRYMDSNKMSDWISDDEGLGQDTASVTLLKDGAVMLVEYSGSSEPYSIEQSYFSMYFKKGAALPGNNDELQGTWYWNFSMDGKSSEIRMAVKFDGDNIDLVIPAWGQRYTGKYTYKDGFVVVGETTFYTSRNENGVNLINMEKPFESEWRIPSDDQGYYPNGLSLPFIVDGKKAYSIFEGLSPVFTKQ